MNPLIILNEIILFPFVKMDLKIFVVHTKLGGRNRQQITLHCRKIAQLT